MDEVLSESVRSLSKFGPDLEELRTIGSQVNDVMKSRGDCRFATRTPSANRTDPIKFDRAAASRYGLQVGQLSEIIETAPMGEWCLKFWNSNKPSTSSCG